jgi:murein DD-endopeptidase MepM/ murein hydrolase activator NlpD
MTSRAAGAAVLLVLAAGCAAFRGGEAELRVAQDEIVTGDPVRGVRRMERALNTLGVEDPERWDALGVTAAGVDDAVSARAHSRAERLRWPDAKPQNATALSLPFSGRWTVTQGNRGAFSHQRLADRFAWDFQMTDAKRGSGGDGPAQAHGLGAPVLATADGVVARVVTDVPDNVGGERNVDQPGGNVVVLRHRAGEFSHYCHLMHGSIAVRPGQRVTRGQVIARCGCSGNAAEPHLHYVLRTGPTPDDTSIPARFEDTRTIGETVDAGGVPREGDFVEPAR